MTGPVQQKYDTYLKRKMSLKTSFTFVLFIALIVWSFIYTGFNVGDLMVEAADRGGRGDRCP